MHKRVFGLVGIKKKKTQMEKMRRKWIKEKLLYRPAIQPAEPGLHHARGLARSRSPARGPSQQ
jgi:hypothetical protein